MERNFGRNFGGSLCTAHEARKCPENAQNLPQFFAQTSAGVTKTRRRNFALGNVRRKNLNKACRMRYKSFDGRVPH